LACSDAGLGVTGPASGGLVFVRKEGGNADLMRARLSDQSVVRITRTPKREEQWPYWSSVTGLVVFQVRPYATSLMSDLQLWNPITGEETALTRTAQRDERWPVWSPTAPELAYSFKRPRESSGIALHETESGETRVVASAGPRDNFRRPEYAPDGRRLVAERRARGELSHLWLLEPGRSPTSLTKGPNRFDGKARFAPDGLSLVFTRRLSKDGPADMVRLELATGEVSHLTGLPEADDHSGLSLRGELAFVSDREGAWTSSWSSCRTGSPRPDPNAGLERGRTQWSPDGGARDPALASGCLADRRESRRDSA
jgi:hypothetical protein